MKTEVYKIKVDKIAGAHILSACDLVNTRAYKLRRTTRDLLTRAAGCTDVDREILENYYGL
jgi:hypothetical protein